MTQPKVNTMATLAIINPKRRKPAARKVAKSRRKNPAKKLSRKTPAALRVYRMRKRPGGKARVRRINPIGMKGLGKLLVPAGVGAASAVVIHEIYSKLATKFAGSIPLAMQSGMGQIVAEAGLAIVVSMALEKTKLIKDANTRHAVLMGALTGLGIKAIQDSGIVSKITGGTATAGYQMIDVAALNGYQMAAAPSPSLGYISSSPNVGTMSNVRNFRRSRTA